MEKRLITSALPYVNNVPHLGNLIQVLSADVFARFCKQRNYETLYICGTDEYGTATETKAREEGITPKELCDRYYAIHTDIYQWFEIAFDRWGRTSTPNHTKIAQDIFLKLYANGYIKEKTIQQLYCNHCQQFLADRYVRGTCPYCGYDGARGDQCESCGKLLDPVDLVEPQCGNCGAAPVFKETNHLYIDLPAIRPKLEAWIDKASVEGKWSRNAIRMTKGWIRDGLKERCITRDLTWGIPVPLDGYRDKVFYVWYDAPIGYISITSNHTDKWEDWWKNPDEVDLFQFIGKDNIPFHTVIFPSSLIGTGERWTLLHHMSSSEYLNYESGKFSKSKGVGVFGNDAKDTGIPADVWRFYIFYNRPETSDCTFTWDDFQEKTNGQLLGNLANLVNRTLSFLYRYFKGGVPNGTKNDSFWQQVEDYERKITDHLENAQLREAFRKIFALASYGNKVFQDGEPWKTKKTAPQEAENLLWNLVYLVKDLAVLIHPYIPATSEKIRSFLNIEDFDWEQLGKCEGLDRINKPELLFQKLEDNHIIALRKRFSGTQQERIMKEEEQRQNKEKTTEEMFNESLELRVAKITDVESHPEADKLYIETIDIGGEERKIVSGLVPYYSEDELKGKNIILVKNLKPAKLRGIKSNGMLLAAETDDNVEVLFVDHAEPGTRIFLEGMEDQAEEHPKRIKIDDFFTIPIYVKEGTAYVGNTPLVCKGKKVTTSKILDGKVG